MEHNLPEIIAIEHDNHFASHVGRTQDNYQFFLTTPFILYIDDANPGREFVAVFLFSDNGELIDARIDDLGPRHELDPKQAELVFDQRLKELGKITYGRIQVAPFQVYRFGVFFGLIPRKSELSGGDWRIILEPGNYMSFQSPWDSGVYDT